MTDYTTTVETPTTIPSNVTTTIRALMALGAGYFINAGKLSIGDANTVIGIAIMVLTLAWGYIKNYSFTKKLVAALLSQPVQFIASKGGGGIPLSAVLLLPMLMLTVGCAGLLGGATTASQNVERAITDAQVAADAAVNVADGLVTSHAVNLATANKIKVIADATDGYAKQARQYYAAGNMVLAAAQLSLLQSVPTQLTATVAAATH